MPSQPTQHTFSTPDPSLWLPADSVGRIVARQGHPHRVLGIYFTASPEGIVVQHSLTLEVDPDAIPRWYLVRTRPGREAVVEKALQDARIKVLLPRLYFQAPREKQRRRGRPKDTVPAGDRVEPLFPGYVFVRLAPGDTESWSRVRRVRGVEDVVGRGPEPLAVPDEVVDTIMEWSAGSGIIVYRGGRPVRAGPCGGSGGTGRMREVERLLREPPPADERVGALMRIVGGEYSDSPVDRNDANDGPTGAKPAPMPGAPKNEGPDPRP